MNNPIGLAHPIESAININPSDEDFYKPTRGIMAFESGMAQMKLVSGDILAIDMQAYVIYPFSVVAILSTGTTTDDFYLLW